MKKILCLLSASLLIITSCSNDDSIDAILPARTVALYAGSDPFVSTFQFNGNKIGSTTTSHDGVSNYWYTSYTYTGNLITGAYNSNSSGGNDVESIFEYDTNERMISRKILYSSSLTADKFLYNYDTEGIVLYEKYSGDFANQTNLILRGKIYKNSGGSVVKREEYIQGILDNSTEYTYDTKNATCKNITGWDKLFSVIGSGAVNNILTESMYNANSGVVTLHSYEYVYNGNNYPVSFSVLVNGGSSNYSGEFFYE